MKVSSGPVGAEPGSRSASPAVDLDELERLAGEATPGPWEHKEQRVPPFQSFVSQHDSAEPVLIAEEQEHASIAAIFGVPDSAFIAAADPQTVTALVRAVRAARVLVDYHGDFLGLPTLSEENLDAAVQQWAELRATLESFATPQEGSR